MGQSPAGAASRLRAPNQLKRLLAHRRRTQRQVHTAYRKPAITEDLKELWGRHFALVPMGLAEDDVSDFVEELMARHRQMVERLEHIDSLHELATRSLQEAQALAEDIKERERKGAD